MTHTTARRSWIVGLAAAAIAALAPGIAQAEPPSNDDFDNATAITALPFQATKSNAEATRSPDDPTECAFFSISSVWFKYTASQDAIIKATAAATGYSQVLAAYTGVRGDLKRVPNVCEFGSNSSGTFHVTAGMTYYLLVASEFGSGTLAFTLDSVPPSPNDNFADAKRVSGLPATFTGDLARAGLEPNEPLPSCNDTATQSVWYTYTPPTARWVSAVVSGQLSATVTVYRGTTLTALSEVDCRVERTPVFRADVGQTYYIRVATDPGEARPFTLDVGTAPPLTPSVFMSPRPASVFNDVQFSAFAGDPLGRPLVGGELRFGDGASATFTGAELVSHRYLRDGMYTVEVTATTDDGRTGIGTNTLQVETHDVTITAFTVPTRARPDQTKPITVSVANTRYDETVQVELFKQDGDFFTHIGTLTQSVPARPGRTVDFPFAYTFSAADAAAGHVTFKAVATLPLRFPLDDANPNDNQRLATTTVRP